VKKENKLMEIYALGEGRNSSLKQEPVETMNTTAC